MAIVISIEQASGRAMCRACKEKIKRNSTTIAFSGIGSKYYFHPMCIKNILKDMLKKPPEDQVCLFSGGSLRTKMEIWVKVPTGRARCPICGKIIKRGLDVLIGFSHDISHFHPGCLRKKLRIN